MDTTTGVIIGRFQVPHLHEGHLNLISGVLNKHQQVIIFLGVPHVHTTKNNPLSFQARRLMILEAFKNETERIVILPIKDQRSNGMWSSILDIKIEEINPFNKAILYGGRDSFIPYYVGKYETRELKLDNSNIISGTSIRKDVSQKTISSEEYRIGVINAVNNQYPVSYQTVDIFCYDKKNKRFLLDKKENESQWRLIGGFVDVTDESLEMAAKRELNEETGRSMETSDYQYFGSFRVDDYRYRKETNKVMSAVYTCHYNFGQPKPSDDIYELAWFDIDESLSEGWFIKNVTDEHRNILIKLVMNIYPKENT